MGFGTSVYGLSNAAEGVHNIELGNAGISIPSQKILSEIRFHGEYQVVS